ncbi:hypothetical protein [uncultured Shewanella sp.]|uniref:hypothetical protein n=1 Tax=uncultured Shewanella sp. TaxID=173975 RepID=UPI00260DE876|nr:hypothetical protein [uncultured Shewanella sp.]
MSHIEELSQSNSELRNAVCLLLLRIGSLEEALNQKTAPAPTSSTILSEDEMAMLNQLF